MWRRFTNPVFADRQRVRELGSYTTGMLAAQQGRPLSYCPFGLKGRANRKRKAWIKGWNDADKTLERVCANVCKEMDDAHNE